MLGLYETWLALRSSLMVSAGMDLEKPRPLHVLVGVRTSVTTGFFSMAAWVQTKVMGGSDYSGPTAVYADPHLWLPTASSARSQKPERQQTAMTSLDRTAPPGRLLGLCVMTWMLANVVCGASLILSFCCAALSAARSLPGALLSATGPSDELDSASERRQSELEDNSTNTLKRDLPSTLGR